MKIELDSIGDSSNKINAYTAGQITIASDVYVSSVLVSAEVIIPEWPPESFSDLSLADIEQILTLDPEIVILGTGSSLIFPAESLIRPIRERSIGFEVMDTGAACRSYNFLVGEGRHVVAALFMTDK